MEGLHGFCSKGALNAYLIENRTSKCHIEFDRLEILLGLKMVPKRLCLKFTSCGKYFNLGFR